MGVVVESRAAARYAKAMLDNAREKGTLDVVREDFRTIEQAIDDSRPLQRMLASPIVDSDKKIAVLREIFGGKVSDDVMRFLDVLSEKGRDPLLRDVAMAFRNMLGDERGIVSADVVVAEDLDDRLKQEIQSRLASMTGKQVEARFRVDSSLVGGFTAKIADKMIDASVRNQLDRLRKSLAEGALTWEARF